MPHASFRPSRSRTPERLAALAEIQHRHGTPKLEPNTFWEVAEKHLQPARPPSPARLLELATA